METVTAKAICMLVLLLAVYGCSKDVASDVRTIVKKGDDGTLEDVIGW